ncbi:glycosyltransferase family 2 protein [Arthrobacter sulfonylureivorans]|uniref:Glycosyltransferase n=1 Tax=Arthrobacter sulfonylureivorans TaxID=2486855 RepID=A0ABY3WE35_9MICC|nr:glycosyltransferase family 2 protein [Arthrobacter sulfonylureivorans]UNK47450.1 glycosyltransferase [Arthrobacter sulfonylureivorans]
MTTPTISIVTPTYNCQSLLQESLESVFNQTLPQSEIEIIVVDDGSTDGTWDYLQSLRAEHPNLKALRQENSGKPSVGRNRGLAAATGEFVFFLDSDDWFSPEALQRMVAAAREHGSDVVVALAVGDNRTVRQASYLKTIYDADVLDDGAWRTLSPWKLFRTSLVRRLGVEFPEDMVQGEDQVFVAQCYLAAEKVTTLADYDYYHLRGREDGGNVSKQRQSLRNKLLTTTRVAEIIVANTEPGRRRQKFFHRIIFRTLAPGLGKPLMTAPADEQQEFLSRIQREVLTSMGSEDLAAARDKSRLRLAVAREGTVAQLTNLNHQLAAGPSYVAEEGRLHFDLGPELNALVPVELRRVTDAAKLNHSFEGLGSTPSGLAIIYSIQTPLTEVPGLALQPLVMELVTRGTSPVTVDVAGKALDDQRWQFVLGADLLPQAPTVPAVWDAHLVLSDGSGKLSSSRASYPRAEDVAQARAVVLLSPEDGAAAYLEAYSTTHGSLSMRQSARPKFTAVKVSSYGDGDLKLTPPRNGGKIRAAALLTAHGRLQLDHQLLADGQMVVRQPGASRMTADSTAAMEDHVPPFVLEVECEWTSSQMPVILADGKLVPLKMSAASRKPSAGAIGTPKAQHHDYNRSLLKRSGLSRLMDRFRHSIRHAPRG